MTDSTPIRFCYPALRTAKFGGTNNKNKNKSARTLLSVGGRIIQSPAKRMGDWNEWDWDPCSEFKLVYQTSNFNFVHFM